MQLPLADSAILYGSGPSAAYWPTPSNPDTLVAAVNAAHAIPDRLDVYGFFEINAGARLRGQMPEVPTYTNMTAAAHAGQLCSPLMRFIGREFGPEDLKDLHDDVRFADPVEDAPDYGEGLAWISSGVKMLWILADVYRPQTIYVAGLDGYPDSRGLAPTYAKGLPDLANKPHTLQQRWHMNRRVEEGVRRITNHPRYAGIDFVWLLKPRYNTDGWRYRTVTTKDLKDLYQGYEQ